MKGIKMIYKKIGRITCDIDDKHIESLIRCLKAFKKYNFTEDVRVTESPSKKGWHVESWIKNWRNDEQAGVSLKKLLKIRKNAGDDVIRRDLDEYGDRAIQVLFTTKHKKIRGKKHDA